MQRKSAIIIAEVGVNHNGDVNIAKKLIEVAAKCGADYVKFQTFKAHELVTKTANKADYQLKNTDNKESQYDMLKALELSEECHHVLIAECAKWGIKFLSSPFDIASAKFLNDLNLDFLKIPSGEITNLPYLRFIGGLGSKIILSTGMSTLSEVLSALNILVSSGTSQQDIIVLHCSSAYPTPLNEVNLNAMIEMREKLSVSVGYSDHTLGITVAIAAVALGALVIEKHITLDKGLLGPDHSASLDPEEFKLMVKEIRNVELCLGNGVKIPAVSESRNLQLVRKSIVALRDIQKGEIFSESNITTKRPGIGLSPITWDEIVGVAAKRNFIKDEFIEK